MCYRCFKAASACICALIPSVDNLTPVTILQHPRERNHPIGTARLAVLGLRRARLVVHGPRNGPSPVVAALPVGAALLYPSSPGEPVIRVARPTHLLVLDGTWGHARRLFHAHPGLASMPRFELVGDQRSRYRLRKEPADHCLSTVEAIVAALRVIEPETRGFDLLLDAFDRMIDRQEVHVSRSGHSS